MGQNALIVWLSRRRFVSLGFLGRFRAQLVLFFFTVCVLLLHGLVFEQIQFGGGVFDMVVGGIVVFVLDFGAVGVGVGEYGRV